MRGPRFGRVRHYLRHLAHQPTLASTVHGTDRRREPIARRLFFEGPARVYFYNEEESTVKIGDHDLGARLVRLAGGVPEDGYWPDAAVDVRLTIEVLDD